MSDTIENYNGFSFGIDVCIEGPDEDVGIFGYSYEATFCFRTNKVTGLREDDFDVVDAQEVEAAYGIDWPNRIDEIKAEILRDFEDRAEEEVRRGDR